MSDVIALEVVDLDPSYGFFGKVVCVSSIVGFTSEQILDEVDYLKGQFPGSYYSLRQVESIPAAA